MYIPCIKVITGMIMMIIIINAMNVEHVTHDHTSYHWSYPNSNIRFIASFASNDEKTFSRFTTHNEGRTAVCYLNRGLWRLEQVPGREGL